MAKTHSIKGDLELLGLMYMGESDSSGTTRTVQLRGSETNIGLVITTKGTGTIQVQSGYEANVSSDQDLINRAYFNSKVAGITAGALVTAPTATEDGYAMVYDHATTSFTLAAVATALTFGNGLTKTADDVKLGGTDLTDEETNVTQNAVGVFRLRTKYTDAADEAGIALEAVAQNNNEVRLYAVGGSIRITPTVMEITAPGAGAMKYVADYSDNLETLSVPHVGWVNDHIGGKSVDANIKAPTSTENNYVIGWQNSTSKYKLIPSPNGEATYSADIFAETVYTASYIVTVFQTRVEDASGTFEASASMTTRIQALMDITI